MQCLVGWCELPNGAGSIVGSSNSGHSHLYPEVVELRFGNLGSRPRRLAATDKSHQSRQRMQNSGQSCGPISISEPFRYPQSR